MNLWNSVNSLFKSRFRHRRRNIFTVSVCEYYILPRFLNPENKQT